MSPFLHMFSPDRLTGGERLHQMMNALVLCIEGFDQDPRELYLISRVRRFYVALHRDWPYSLYFADLNNDWLKILAFCCLRQITSLTTDGSAKCGVEVDPSELAHWIGSCFAPMNSLCERAQMTERGIYDRSKAIFEYFKLPFEV